jgi:SAM-dependent methyltransferase
MTSALNHQNKILERFTATADVFAESVRTMRVEESDRLVELATAGLALDSESLVIDVACGPGTFTRPFASRVRRAVGVDLTPAMIEKARAEAARAGITNIEFVHGNIYALPFADGVASIVVRLRIHHMQEPAQASRKWRACCVPADASQSISLCRRASRRDPNNERLSPIAHQRSTVSQFRSLIKDASLRPLSKNCARTGTTSTYG